MRTTDRWSGHLQLAQHDQLQRFVMQNGNSPLDRN